MSDEHISGDLQAENQRLRKRVELLESQLLFLGQHRTLAEGIRGETLISALVNGKLTVHTASVDVVTDSGTKIEVKMGKLTYPKPASQSAPSRWQWGKVFGEKNNKDFDFLLLVGEADPRYRDFYKDPAAPYVMFMLNRLDAERLSTVHTRGARGMLLLTNPRSTGKKAGEIFSKFQITASQLTERLGSISG